MTFFFPTRGQSLDPAKAVCATARSSGALVRGVGLGQNPGQLGRTERPRPAGPKTGRGVRFSRVSL